MHLKKIEKNLVDATYKPLRDFCKIDILKKKVF